MNVIKHAVRRATDSDERERGFTMIELLVIVIIIGILAAIIYPQLVAQSAKGKNARAVSDLRNSVTSVQSYLGNNPSAYGVPSFGPVTGNQQLDPTTTMVLSQGDTAYEWVDTKPGVQGYCLYIAPTGGSHTYWFDSILGVQSVDNYSSGGVCYAVASGNV